METFRKITHPIRFLIALPFVVIIVVALTVLTVVLPELEVRL